MNRILSFLLFFTIISTVYFGMHFYLFRRIATAYALTGPGLLLLRVLFIAGGISFIAGEMLERNFSIRYLLDFGVVWMGLVAIGLSAFVLGEGFRLALPGHGGVIATVCLLTAAVVGGYSLFNGIQDPRQVDITVPVARLDPSLEGYRIVQLSDLHLDGRKSAAKLDRTVERALALKPDLLVITGDLIDRSFEAMAPYLPGLKKLHARDGVLTVPGNHEYYSGIDNYLRLVSTCGFREMSNQVTQVSDHFQVAGIPDPTGERFELLQPKYRETLESLLPGKTTLLLYHQPLRFAEAVERGVTLQLSGHTHAGQIPPMELIVRLVYRFPYGLYRLGPGAIYTTCGTFSWGPPMRFMNHSELVRLTLTAGPGPSANPTL